MLSEKDKLVAKGKSCTNKKKGGRIESLERPKPHDAKTKRFGSMNEKVENTNRI